MRLCCSNCVRLLRKRRAISHTHKKGRKYTELIYTVCTCGFFAVTLLDLYFYPYVRTVHSQVLYIYIKKIIDFSFSQPLNGCQRLDIMVRETETVQRIVLMKSKVSFFNATVWRIIVVIYRERQFFGTMGGMKSRIYRKRYFQFATCRVRICLMKRTFPKLYYVMKIIWAPQVDIMKSLQKKNYILMHLLREK